MYWEDIHWFMGEPNIYREGKDVSCFSGYSRATQSVTFFAHSLHPSMPSLLRTIRSMRRVGLKEWWRQLQYIGDAKSGTFVGADQ